VISAAKRADLQPGMEGFSFVAPGSPIFGDTLRWTLINEFNNEIIGAYELDANGDATGPRQVFLTDAGGPEGSVFDPITSDLIVSDLAYDRLYQVTGFAPPTAMPTPTLTQTPTPTPTPTPTATPSATPTGSASDTPAPSLIAAWGDANCSGEADLVDSLLTLREDAGLPVDTGDCPQLGAEVDVLFASLHIWGDVDCSGALNLVDSLKILRFDAGLSVLQEEGCPLIGAQVTIVS